MHLGENIRHNMSCQNFADMHLFQVTAVPRLCIFQYRSLFNREEAPVTAICKCKRLYFLLQCKQMPEDFYLKMTKKIPDAFHPGVYFSF